MAIAADCEMPWSREGWDAPNIGGTNIDTANATQKTKIMFNVENLVKNGFITSGCMFFCKCTV